MSLEDKLNQVKRFLLREGLGKVTGDTRNRSWRRLLKKLHRKQRSCWRRKRSCRRSYQRRGPSFTKTSRGLQKTTYFLQSYLKAEEEGGGFVYLWFSLGINTPKSAPIFNSCEWTLKCSGLLSIKHHFGLLLKLSKSNCGSLKPFYFILSNHSETFGAISPCSYDHFHYPRSAP